MEQKKKAAANKREGLSFETRHYGTVNVITNAYNNGGRLAVEIESDAGEPVAMLSVNIPEKAHLLEDGEFFAKTWTENRDIAEDALASGVFRNTGRTSGEMVHAQIWTFR